MPGPLTFILAVMMTAGAFAEDPSNEESPIDAYRTCIEGVVMDKISGEKLTGVRVSLLGTGRTSYTDVYGEFRFDHLSPGDYKIQLEYISYRSKKIEDVPLCIPGLGELSIELEPSQVEASGLTNQDAFDRIR